MALLGWDRNVSMEQVWLCPALVGRDPLRGKREGVGSRVSFPVVSGLWMLVDFVFCGGPSLRVRFYLVFWSMLFVWPAPPAHILLIARMWTVRHCVTSSSLSSNIVLLFCYVALRLLTGV